LNQIIDRGLITKLKQQSANAMLMPTIKSAKTLGVAFDTVFDQFKI
jgi:hypothetical protein